jgi:polysaccharide export outer membrane protein
MRFDSVSRGLAGFLVLLLIGLAGCAAPRAKTITAPRQAPRTEAPKLSASVYGVNAAATNRIQQPVVTPGVRPAVTPPARPAATPELSGIREAAAYRLRPGDPLIIYLRGIYPRDEQIEQMIDERGFINLPHIDTVLAAGRTSSELEAEIQRTYIERKIYRQITVNVVMPSQSYYIRGEVQRPGRYPLVTGTTVLQAIAAAGGYTDYANPKNIRITRGGKVINVNARDLERRPERDVDVESGDVIVVPRSLL